MDKEKMNNDPQNTSEEITERIEEMIEEETETGAGTVSISDRLREAEADENDYDADVEDGYDEAEYDEADGEVDGENEYGEASEDAEYVEDEYSEEEEEEDDDDEPRIVVNPKVVKVASLILFSGIILVFASIAWFTMNREVGSSGMSVKTVGSLYELQTSGTTATYAYLLNDEALGYSSGTEVSPGVFRTGSTGKLTLMLSSNDDPMNVGLQPGKRGSFSFTIVPNDEMIGDSNHQLQVSYTISMKGYYLSAEKKEAIMVYNEIIAEGETPTAEQTAAAEITFSDLHPIDGLTAGEGDNDKHLAARNLLNGHLLFFDDYTNSKYSDLIDFSIPGVATVDYEDTTTVTINWIWPETFADIVDDEDTVIASDYLDDVVDYIVDNENYFFYNLNKAKITGLNEGELTRSAVVNDNNYLAFSTGYNNADQCIGEDVQFVLIEITTDASIIAKEEP